jgi:hemerythrin-like domain-containing protein
MDMKQNFPILSHIRADHREIKELFGQIEKTTERAVKTRDKLYAKLREEISLHTRAEENVVYPRLKQHNETEDLGYESVEEHGVVSRLLTQIDGTPAESKEWTALICVLQETIEKHIRDEESEMFTKMRKVFKADELKEMGEQFERAKMGFVDRLADMVAAA